MTWLSRKSAAGGGARAACSGEKSKRGAPVDAPFGSPPPARQLVDFTTEFGMARPGLAAASAEGTCPTWLARWRAAHVAIEPRPGNPRGYFTMIFVLHPKATAIFALRSAWISVHVVGQAKTLVGLTGSS